MRYIYNLVVHFEDLHPRTQGIIYLIISAIGIALLLLIHDCQERHQPTPKQQGVDILREKSNREDSTVYYINVQ